MLNGGVDHNAKHSLAASVLFIHPPTSVRRLNDRPVAQGRPRFAQWVDP